MFGEDEEFNKIRNGGITKEWDLTGNVLKDFIHTWIKTFKKENRWANIFSEKQLDKISTDLLTKIGAVVKLYLGEMGYDFFKQGLELWIEAKIEEERVNLRIEQVKEEKEVVTNE